MGFTPFTISAEVVAGISAGFCVVFAGGFVFYQFRQQRSLLLSDIFTNSQSFQLLFTTLYLLAFRLSLNRMQTFRLS